MDARAQSGRSLESSPNPKVVSEPTLKRLPPYHRFLLEWQAAGKETVSCTDIGRDLKLDPTQVRKDLESVGIVGRPRIGYVTASILSQLEDFLGWKNVNEAFLVGAGSMGSALLGYRKFEQCGLKIVAAFDTDPSKVGQLIHGKHVLALDKLPDLARRMHILIGIITVPAEAAQAITDLMVSGGITAIWNFAPIRLRVPDHIIVHNEDLYSSLASLSQKLSKSLQTRPAKMPDESSSDTPVATAS
jgi:redox-sensing transcriptional repressor